MKWCIDNLDFLCNSFDDFRMNRLFLQLFHIFVINFRSDHLIKSCCFGSLLVHCLNLIKRSNLCDLSQDVLIMRRCDLCTILPINFVSVVLSRIMACCDNNTCDTGEFTHCERKLRCRSKTLKYICLNSICVQTKCCFICKFRRHDTGIISDCHTFLLSVLRNNIICKSLCCLTYSVNVHTVGSGSDHTTKSTCTELKLTVKAILDFILVPFDCLKFSLCCLVKVTIGTPFLIFFLVIHDFSPFLNIFFMKNLHNSYP